MSEKRKLHEVRVYYSFEEKWETIAVQYDDGHEITVSREQIEAFLRMRQILEDLEGIQKLQDRLSQIFPKKP